MKICTVCRLEKDLQEFNPNRFLKSGLQSYCKSCGNKRAREWRSLNKEKVKEYHRSHRRKEAYKEWRELNIDRLRAKEREYRNKNKERLLEKGYFNRIKRKYGVTKEQYLKMMEDQKGVCAICKGLNLTTRKRLVVDHCHKTGKVRGLLCDPCNKGIGLLRDSDGIAHQAQIYLADY